MFGRWLDYGPGDRFWCSSLISIAQTHITCIIVVKIISQSEVGIGCKIFTLFQNSKNEKIWEFPFNNLPISATMKGNVEYNLNVLSRIRHIGHALITIKSNKISILKSRTCTSKQTLYEAMRIGLFVDHF